MKKTNLQRNILLLGLILLIAGIGLFVFSVETRFVKRITGENGMTGPTQEKLKEANEYLQENSKKAAERAKIIFTKIYTGDNTSALNRQFARYGLGVALRKLDDKRRALQHFRALKEKGAVSKYLSERIDYSLGSLLLEINHEAEGRSLLEALLTRTRDKKLKSRVHSALGYFFLRRGKKKRAGENFTIALKYFPDNLDAEFGRARALRGLGYRGYASDFYYDYLAGIANLDPKKRKNIIRRLNQDYYDAAIKEYRRSHYRSAIKLFKKVIKRETDGAIRERAFYWLAESYNEIGNRQKALQYFTKVYQNSIVIMDQPAIIKKGILLYQKGEIKRAAALFQKAEENFPRSMYTAKAAEWRREALAQIREDSDLDKPEYDDEQGEQKRLERTEESSKPEETGN